MSAEPKYTERDKVMFLREGFAQALHERVLYSQGMWHDLADAQRVAAVRYPLPKITRPRVVKDVPMWMNYEFRVVDRVFQSRTLTSGLDDWSVQTISTRRTFEQLGPVYADLLATPTEEVDADA